MIEKTQSNVGQKPQRLLFSLINFQSEILINTTIIVLFYCTEEIIIYVQVLEE